MILASEQPVLTAIHNHGRGSSPGAETRSMLTAEQKVHWLDCDVVTTIRDRRVEDRVRLCLRHSNAVVTDWGIIETAAIRKMRRRCGISSCIQFSRFEVQPRDWSDTIDRAATAGGLVLTRHA